MDRMTSSFYSHSGIAKWNLSDERMNDTVDHLGIAEIRESVFLQYFLGIIYATIILVSFTGNLLVVLAVLTNKRLQNVNHYLLMSLAFADLTVTILVMPFALHYDIGGGWEYGREFCSFWMSVDVMCCTASLQHLCAVAWDRYVAISDPFGYTTRMAPVRVTLLIFGIWICSGLISFLPIFMGWFANDNALAVPDHQCFLQTNPVYAVISASISFYLPLCGMVFCYVKIFKIAWEKNRTFQQQQQSIQSSLQTSLKPGQTTDNRSPSSASHWKATKTLGIIFGLFVLSWLPFFIIYWIDSFAEPGFVPQPLHSVITWLGYLNSIMNPIVYAQNDDFRAAYCRLFTRVYYMCRKSKRGLVKGMCHTENNYSMVFSNFSNGDELTEEDILELEQIFWPVSKPLFNPILDTSPGALHRNDNAVGARNGSVGSGNPKNSQQQIIGNNDASFFADVVIPVTFNPSYRSF